ncbi:fumarylacetoacetate hydrolase family protein [Azospirillum thermophilum]|uniref:2-keto-4-pentenoate hydratase n=1 Tax=Azospirillum thermophilum TaxID=2202148 RepID=A0A2S2CNV0_9PROT|nr:fumarylacetoacetate hydrolase family protein [Azospirillum thermophilum]AWK86162.1 2-keto-4-pentenoate hydratase [Azospirillum thermophilum]
MKLASLKAGGRDGTLVVVSRDLSRCRPVPEVAPTLQAALDRWAEAAPRLEEACRALNADPAAGQPFDQTAAASPLPRAYQWADGSAYVNHVELVRKARGAEMPPSFWTDPLMYQGASDGFLAPTDPIPAASEEWGIDFEAEIAVITDDVPMGAGVEQAKDHIRLLMLVNDVSLRNLIPAELAKGFGFFQSKPASSFSPVAVTPDELGDAWDGGKVHLPLVSHLNGALFGKPNAGIDMTFDFPTLIAHVARTRSLVAGSIVGSGTVSNKLDGGPGKPVDQGGVGYSCLAELRTIETIDGGKPKTPFLRFGDRVRIELFDAAGVSVFGAIDQEVVKYEGA